MRRWERSGAVVGVLVLLGSLAWGGSAAARTPVGTHEAFFLRVAAGLGGASGSVETDAGVDVGLSGFSLLWDISAGWAVLENLFVHAEFYGSVATDPTLDVGSREFGTESVDYDNYGFGTGVTYHVAPWDVYVSGTIGLAWVDIGGRGVDVDTETGFGLNLKLGKEWWVAKDFALGLAGQFFFTTVPTAQDDNFDTVGGGVLVSVSYD